MDSNVFYGNIMPCKLYVDMLSGLYKTWTIPFNDYGRDEECFVVEFEDINSIVRLSLVLNKPITIGKRVFRCRVNKKTNTILKIFLDSVFSC